MSNSNFNYQTQDGVSVLGFQNSKDKMEAVDVTKRVQDGRTKVFTDDQRQDAETYAKQKGSYLYDVYAKVQRGGVRRVEYFGYAVPN